MSPIDFRVIESEVPYSPLINSYLQLHKSHLNEFVERSRKYERSYLAWEIVRRVGNPFFVDGTGLEGYYVGQCNSPEEIGEQLLQIGRTLLENNCRYYRFNHLFRARLMKTILYEVNDPEAIEVWSAQFGAVIAQLRCKLLTNLPAKYFQADTYQSVSNVPAIRYAAVKGAISQRYAVHSGANGTNFHGQRVLEALVKPGDEDAWQVIKSLGKFGHPLLRQYVIERSTFAPLSTHF